MARTKKDDAASAKEPKKPGRVAQIRQVFTASRKIDPLIGWWMLLAFVVTVAIVTLIGFLLGHWTYALIVSFPMGLLAATLVFSRRAERAAFKGIEGQPGATGAALSGLRRNWYYTKEPVAADANRGDMNSAAVVYRAVGRPGVILLAEGPRPRAAKLLAAEKKRIERVAPGVPVTGLHTGDGEGDVPIRKVVRRLTRMKPVITKQEASVVNKRLKSLGGLKPPVPKGMDPMRARVDRKGMRGR